ncbi:hypothetical protein EPUL_002841 [Erysiphe pulchra]|uniref:CCHC-type domain-containing protein n=1 Tax=Erysiphe pulchra TaxID=225359 RepID=A0A2S4PPU8_9PEZI|nr:hypothetical protein EPUL_002841 [Erysiphe pulchra]
MPDYGTIHRTARPYSFSSSEGSHTSSNSIKSESEAPTYRKTPSISLALESAFQTLELQDQVKNFIINSKMTDGMPSLPELTVESFDGTTAGARFLMALKLNLRNIDLETWPGLWIQAVYIKVKGEAAVWMDSTPHIAALVDTLETVTVAQKKNFDIEFKAQFPGAQINPTKVPDHLELTTFRQRPDETLQAYEFRASEIWRKIVEAPGVVGAKGIAASIGYSVFVSAFVNGLHDNILRIQAIRQGAVTVSTIPEAIQAVDRAYQITVSEILYSQRVENPVWNALRDGSQVQGYVHSVHQGAQIQSAAVCFPQECLSSALKAQFTPLLQKTLNPREDPVVYYPRSIPKQGLPTQSKLTFPQSVPSLSKQEIPLPQQENASRAYRNGYAGPPPPHQGSDRRPMPHKYVNPRFNPMTSNVPVVNGSERMARHCTNCGRDDGHSYRACPNVSLTVDEKNTLYNMIAKNHNLRFFGVEYPEVNSIQAQLQRNQDETLERSYGPPRPVTPFYQTMEINKEDESENWPTVEFENLTGIREGQGASGSRSANSINLPFTMHQTQLVNQTKQVQPAESFGFSVGLFSSSEELEVSRAISELQIIGGQTSEANSVVVPKEFKPLSIDDIFEKAVLEVQAIETSRKRQRIDVEGMLNQDDDHQFEPRAPKKFDSQTEKRTTLMDELESELGEVKDKKKKKNNRQLNEINGREGLGPIDYKDMLAQIRVNLSILDLMQISPDAAKAFKHYSTRRNQKRGKKQSQSNKVNANPLISSDQMVAPRGIQQCERPFRLLDATIVCPKLKTKTILNMGATQADQGSDINLISDLLVSTLSLEKREIPGVGGFMMQTADGNLTTLRTFAVFKLGVAGIWRTVHAYIRLKPRSGTDTISLILGLPWLYSVKATINIFENCIAIGDPVNHPKDEKRQIIKCAVWKSSPHQQLMLAPSSKVIAEAIKPRTLDPHAHVDYPSERESSNDESDESETDEQSNDDLSLK